MMRNRQQQANKRNKRPQGRDDVKSSKIKFKKLFFFLCGEKMKKIIKFQIISIKKEEVVVV